MKIAANNLINVAYISLWILFLSFIICLPKVQAQVETAEEYIEAGENQLLEKTPASIMAAYNTFQVAQGTYSTNSVINTYLALTRVANLFLTEDPAGAQALLEPYGFLIERGATFDEYSMNPPDNINGDIILPETAPSGEAIRSFLADSFVAALDASIDNLDMAVENWTDTDKYIIAKTKLNTYADIEFDYGDLLLLRAWFKGVKCISLIVSAYDLDVSVRETITLSNAGLFNFKEFLKRYEDLLKLLPTTTTPSGDGAAMLVEARSVFLGMIEDYLDGTTHIKSDTDTNTGAEELFEIDECNMRGEEYIRTIVEDVRDSLIDGTTAFQVVNDNETWLFTDGDTSNQIEVILENDKSDGYFSGVGTCDFIDCGGSVECVIIDGDQIIWTVSTEQMIEVYVSSLYIRFSNTSGAKCAFSG